MFYQGGLWASNVKMMSLYMLYGASLRVGEDARWLIVP